MNHVSDEPSGKEGFFERVLSSNPNFSKYICETAIELEGIIVRMSCRTALTIGLFCFVIRDVSILPLSALSQQIHHVSL